jgi:hypothetical protein
MSQLPPDEIASAESPLTEFRVYRLVNPATDCEYAYLAATTDRSALLSLGHATLCFEMPLPSEAEIWLTEHFAPTEEVIRLDFTGLRYLLDLTFPSGVEFGFVLFDDVLKLTSIELSLVGQARAEASPEYLLRTDGTFERLDREKDQRRRISAAEEVLLQACAASFTAIATENPHLLRALPPPRFRELGRKPSLPA